MALQRATLSSYDRFVRGAAVEARLPRVGAVTGVIEAVYLNSDESLAWVFVRDSSAGYLYVARYWECWFEEDSALAPDLPTPS
ncbi:MAG: hypothetical protein HYT62_00530 [Candidatus Yanofskybacteria bacterium]|nr:hypothetical protein [Candidatus Yanofskybacteria bacterium]